MKPTENLEALNKNGFVGSPELHKERILLRMILPPMRIGYLVGWLIEVEDEPLEHEASDREVDSDLESTASSRPMLKKTAKAIPDHMFRNYPYCSK
ncbi:hypothetical protein Tco_0077170 [Tanacetum coccineum]